MNQDADVEGMVRRFVEAGMHRKTARTMANRLRKLGFRNVDEAGKALQERFSKDKMRPKHAIADARKKPVRNAWWQRAQGFLDKGHHPTDARQMADEAFPEGSVAVLDEMPSQDRGQYGRF